VDCENEDTAEFRKFRHQLFHTTLAYILSSLRCGMSKPEVQQCPDGHFRCAAYALAAYIADYPEQVHMSIIICTGVFSATDPILQHANILVISMHLPTILISSNQCSRY